MLPYGRQWIDEDDVAAVVDVLRSDWLTTGPRVAEFETAFARAMGAREAVAVNSGTAALHAATRALRIGPGDEVLVPALTFAASANAVVYEGGTPVFVDVDPGTLLIDPAAAAAAVTPRTKGIVAVDYAGQPCDYDRLGPIAARHGLKIIADACHAAGARLGVRPVGSLADLSAFSFHPVKHITTGEGGMITTDSADMAAHMRRFRNHGISSDARQREAASSWFYEMQELGYNYRLTDIQCALGQSQLKKLAHWVVRRREIARTYDEAFETIPAVRPLTVRSGVTHAYHLYVIRLDFSRLRTTRREIFTALRRENIGVNVHYVPVHLHPYYRERFQTRVGSCPVAETAYEEILSLPLFPQMSVQDARDVVTAVQKVCHAHER